MSWSRIALASVALCVALSGASSEYARAWSDHATLTRLCLQDYENWPKVSFEPIQKVLPALSVDGVGSIKSVDDFAKALQIRSNKVNWDWRPNGDPSKSTLHDVLIYSVDEPDHGFDQNLTVTTDQKYMGGYTGPSSQGFRHMYYRAWNYREPLVTFHFPIHEMGQAPARAALYFSLATQAAKSGHSFWAHRFLGWGLHYVGDLSQPYHANQFASFRLLKVMTLLRKGWEPFVQETARIVANFHLSFESYIERLLRRSDSDLHSAFRVPAADEGLSAWFGQGSLHSVESGVKRLAESSSRLAPMIVAEQNDAWGELLFDRRMNLVEGERDAEGKSKINYDQIEASDAIREKRKALEAVALRALSNGAVATRWYVDRFRAESQ